ncbi:MAG: ECF transporter S component [Oscillospiraceae bacterium]|nr:ECF transporter S component [Oscillospiraceae bacterium]
MKELLANAKENLSFLLVSLLIIVGIIIVAALAQKFLCKSIPKRRGARYVAFVAMFGAIAAVLMLFEIPLFFAPSFYELDLSEIPVLMCSFYLGPVAGVVCELLKIVIKLLLKGTSTAFVGDFANFVVGCTFVLPASIIYHFKKSKKSAIIGMSAGTAVMTVFGSLFNAVYLLPKFATIFGMPLEAIIGMGTQVNSAINSVSTLVLFAVVPFNLLKGVVVSVATFFLYKRLEPIFFRK